MLYPLDDPALLGIPPMSYHCHLIDVTWTNDNDNWPEDVRLIFSLSFSPSFPLFFSICKCTVIHIVCSPVHVYMPLFPSSFLSPSIPFFILLYLFSLSLSPSLSRFVNGFMRLLLILRRISS